MKETHNIVWTSFHRFYHNLFVRILRFPRLTLVVIGLIMVAGLSFFPYLGGEFLPKLEEGNIWARATLPLTTSLSNADEVAGGVRRVFQSFPEVTTRSLSNRPAGRWFRYHWIFQPRVLCGSEATRTNGPRGLTKDELVAQIDRNC